MQDLDAETLAETTTQYNVEICELKAKNTELSNVIASQQQLQTEVCQHSY